MSCERVTFTKTYYLSRKYTILPFWDYKYLKPSTVIFFIYFFYFTNVLSWCPLHCLNAHVIQHMIAPAADCLNVKAVLKGKWANCFRYKYGDG